MSQTLHIFRKDIRHHWPEVLVSLLLLAAFVWHEPAEWSGNFPSFSLLQILFSFVNTLLPLSWCLMIVRLVHEERSEEHTSELQSHHDLVCRLLLEKKNNA